MTSHDESLAVERATLRLDVSKVAPDGVHTSAADIAWCPGLAHRHDTLVVCLPGGAMSKRYFDLRGVDGDDAFSMAAHLARRGFVVASLDHPGVGDSDAPDDEYTLTPPVVADTDAAAVRALVDAVRSGRVGGLGPDAARRVIGCGHSMGGLLTVHVQARHRVYDALALLGFGGGGLPQVLTPDELAVAHDPTAALAVLASLVRERFGRPRSLARTVSSPNLLRVPVSDEAIAVVDTCASYLLNQCGLWSMLPGVSDAEMASVDVPVLIGVGDQDITGPPHRIPGSFTGSCDVTLYVCPESGHNHHVMPNRALLWDRLVAWMGSLG